MWGDADPEAVRRFVAPGYRRYTGASAEPLDIDDQVGRLHALRNAFPDISLSIDDVVAEDDRVAFRGTLRGTHRGEFLGIAATGREVVVTIVDIARIEDGRIIEHWGGPDLFDLNRQLTTPTGSIEQPPPRFRRYPDAVALPDRGKSQKAVSGRSMRAPSSTSAARRRNVALGRTLRANQRAAATLPS